MIYRLLRLLNLLLINTLKVINIIIEIRLCLLNLHLQILYIAVLLFHCLIVNQQEIRKEVGIGEFPGYVLLVVLCSQGFENIVG